MTIHGRMYNAPTDLLLPLMHPLSQTLSLKSLLLAVSVCAGLSMAASEPTSIQPAASARVDSVPVYHDGAPPLDPTVSKKRKWTAGLVQGGFTLSSFIGLNQAWYANYPKQDFHFFNDEDDFMSTAGRTWRSNCVMDTSKSAAAGIAMRPVTEALEEAVERWEGE